MPGSRKRANAQQYVRKVAHHCDNSAGVPSQHLADPDQPSATAVVLHSLQLLNQQQYQVTNMPNGRKNQPVKFAAPAAPKRVPKMQPPARKPQAAQRPRQPTCRNDYLASLLDPFNGAGVGIPDFDTNKVLTSTTRYRYPIATNAGGFAVYAFQPAFNNGGIKVGSNEDGSVLHCMTATSANLGTDDAAFTFSLVKSADRTLFQADFLSVRPVSMGVKFVPTQAATAIEGLLHVVDYVPGRARPFRLSNTAAAVSNGGIEKALGPITGGAAPAQLPVFASLTDIETSADHINRIALETVTTWTPELPDNLAWCAMGNNGEGHSESIGFPAYNWENTNTTTVDQYLLSAEYENLMDDAGNPIWDPAGPGATRSPMANYPMCVWAFSGATASTTIGEIEVVINWEIIVRPALTSILPTRTIASNPDEFAQAANVMQSVPKTYYPTDPNEPTTRIRPLLLSSVNHLYDGTPRKAAVEGTSLWSKIKSIGGRVLGAAAPFLAKVPGLGAVLGPGAALLSELARN